LEYRTTMMSVRLRNCVKYKNNVILVRFVLHQDSQQHVRNNDPLAHVYRDADVSSIAP
jgi:hypothetical protein